MESFKDGAEGGLVEQSVDFIDQVKDFMQDTLRQL